MRRITTYLLPLAAASVLFVRCSVGPENPLEPVPSDCRFGSFSIPAGANMIDAGIDHSARTVTVSTTAWMSDPDALVPRFTAGGTVTVDGVEQVSGSSAVDFHATGGVAVYTVTSETGEQAVYTVTIDSPMFSGLPSVGIEVDGGVEITQKTETYYGAHITIEHPDKPSQSIASRVGIRGRGNNSWTKPKKPWRIRFDDPVSILGLAPARSWVLLANWQDPTLIMNETAFELGRRFGIPYTNNSRFVDLWINGAYRGNYQITEQIQAGRNRVAIDEDSGGFLAELDTYYDEEPKFRTAAFNLPVMVKDPDGATAADVKPAFDALEAALANGSWRDHADEESFIDYMLVTEIVRNPESGHPKSLFMYRHDASSKLCFGPLWDFGWAFGYAADNSSDYFRPKAMPVLYGPHRTETTKGIGFLSAFYKDPELAARYKARWNEMMENGRIEGIIPFVGALSQSLARSQRHNFTRWPNGKDYAEQIGLMQSWLAERIETLDREISKF